MEQTVRRPLWVLFLFAALFSIGDHATAHRENQNITNANGGESNSSRSKSYSVGDVLKEGNTAPHTNEVSIINNRNNAAGGGGGGGGGWGWGGGGGGGGGFAWGWGGGGGGGQGWRWGCGGGRSRSGNGANEKHRHKSRSVKHQYHYHRGVYRVGQYAECMGEGRCRGMRLDCPLHCGGPCFYDCEYMCKPHCRRHR